MVDDYAHHPTEVAALLRAARTVAGAGRVLVLFQPHLFSRTRAFAAEFAEALSLADEVVVTDVYAAREDPDPDGLGCADHRRDGADRPVRPRPDRGGARRWPAWPGPATSCSPSGAGDVTELGPVILADLGRAGES